jgi:hypothetical protein
VPWRLLKSKEPWGGGGEGGVQQRGFSTPRGESTSRCADPVAPPPSMPSSPVMPAAGGTQRTCYSLKHPGGLIIMVPVPKGRPRLHDEGM